MRSYPPQYPRSSIPLNPSPSLFYFFPSPSFSLIFLFSFAPFLFVLLLFVLSFFPDLPSFFFVLSTFSSFSFFLLFLLFFVCVHVRVCVYLRMYVRAYLAIPCVSANDSVRHTKPKFTKVFDKKINNMKQMWNVKRTYVYKYTADVR